MNKWKKRKEKSKHQEKCILFNEFGTLEKRFMEFYIQNIVS